MLPLGKLLVIFSLRRNTNKRRNAVELIVSIIALVKKNIVLVQTSLIGSMLSNLLLVMGMCFYFGGLGREQQFFNETVAQTAASLLALSVGALIIPTAYTWNQSYNTNGPNDEELSRGTAIILLVVYVAFLIFQLSSHKEMYNKKSQKVTKRQKPPGKMHRQYKKAKAHMHKSQNTTDSDESEPSGGDDDDAEEPSLTFAGAMVTLCLATALIGVNAEFLVDSISDVTCKYNVSEVFVGLILLPIVGNAAEHATAVTVAVKDKMDLAIGVAVGSSMQIALFVLPLSVLIGWWIHADMTLVFDSFQIAVLFVAVILVNYLIGDGASHWLEGMQLMCL
jgi:Ca2+:H+ antiporter